MLMRLCKYQSSDPALGHLRLLDTGSTFSSFSQRLKTLKTILFELRDSWQLNDDEFQMEICRTIETGVGGSAEPNLNNHIG
jgi:hypothetical protein